MKRLFVMLLVIAVFVCCSGKKIGGEFSGFGISFSYPSDWEMSEHKNYDHGINFVLFSGEKSGKNAVYTVTWTQAADIPDFLFADIRLKNISENTAYESFSTDDIARPSYSEYKGVGISYQGIMNGEEYKGEIYAFTTHGTAVCVTKQYAASKASEVAEDYQLFEDTFKLTK